MKLSPVNVYNFQRKFSVRNAELAGIKPIQKNIVLPSDRKIERTLNATGVELDVSPEIESDNVRQIKYEDGVVELTYREPQLSGDVILDIWGYNNLQEFYSEYPFLLRS